MQTLSMYPTQTNTKSGLIQVLASEDLTGKEGLIGVVANDSGVLKVGLPGAITDPVEYLIVSGAAAGEYATLFPLDRSTNVRVTLDGTCNPGDILYLAPIDGTHDGMLQDEPAGAGDYVGHFRAEEIGVDGQRVLCRLLNGTVATTVE